MFNRILMPTLLTLVVIMLAGVVVSELRPPALSERSAQLRVGLYALESAWDQGAADFSVARCESQSRTVVHCTINILERSGATRCTEVIKMERSGKLDAKATTIKACPDPRWAKA